MMPRPKVYQSNGIRCDECDDLQIGALFEFSCRQLPGEPLWKARLRCGKRWGIMIPSSHPRVIIANREVRL
jgi:hypothetical protein